jgi:hypothetical protein
VSRSDHLRTVAGHLLKLGSRPEHGLVITHGQLFPSEGFLPVEQFGQLPRLPDPMQAARVEREEGISPSVRH